MFGGTQVAVPLSREEGMHPKSYKQAAQHFAVQVLSFSLHLTGAISDLCILHQFWSSLNISAPKSDILQFEGVSLELRSSPI